MIQYFHVSEFEALFMNSYDIPITSGREEHSASDPPKERASAYGREDYMLTNYHKQNARAAAPMDP